MARYFFPIILVLIAVGVYFAGIDPLYSDITDLSEKRRTLSSALSNSRQIAERRDELLGAFNSVASADIERLRRVLPDNVDNVRLILEIDSIAARYGMALQDVVIDTDTRAGEGALGPDMHPYGTLGLHFTVTGSYAAYMRFLEDLERSLRLVDITELSFVAGSTDFHQYEVGIKTYWLK
ncbi:MAG: hypothetical protein HY457_00940 [Parcubacteria group bacterium]|nr:hypothetical protein [Parcubacteria group bacterium]